MLYLDRFNLQLTTLCERIQCDYPTKLSEAMIYSLTAGGKRVRPSMVYATAETFGASVDEVDAAALAVECIHTYSLIHDDLPDMDDDDLRRGQSSCHKKFGNGIAILAGDALQGLAFLQLSQQLDNDQAEDTQTSLINAQIAILANAAVQMVAGQTLDIEIEKRHDITQSELADIHRLKTGELINASILMGWQASMQTHDIDTQAILSRIAFALGLHFQILDDIFDVTKTSKILGKPAGSDFASSKITYASLLGIKTAQNEVDNLAKQIYRDLHTLEIVHSPLAKIIENVINREK